VPLAPAGARGPPPRAPAWAPDPAVRAQLFDFELRRWSLVEPTSAQGPARSVPGAPDPRAHTRDRGRFRSQVVALIEHVRAPAAWYRSACRAGGALRRHPGALPRTVGDLGGAVTR
jgi:hypothetical protein